MSNLTVLVKTRDVNFGESLSEVVSQCGAKVVLKFVADDFFAINRTGINLILLDIRESTDEAVAFLRRVRNTSPQIEVMLINRKGNIRPSMQGMQAGACDELMVPIDKNALKEKLELAARRFAGKRKRKSIFDRFSDVMAAATFAQAGEFETALELMNDPLCWDSAETLKRGSRINGIEDPL